MRPHRLAATLVALGCATAAGLAAAATFAGALGSFALPGTVGVVAAESQYASVVSQVGGRFVTVAAVMSNPNTDPHEFEASARVAVDVSQARLVVQNGMGYDSFMGKLEAADAPPGQRVVVAQDLFRSRPSSFNPHLWYLPATMPLVARAVAADLSQLAPGHERYFAANLARFDASLRPYTAALRRFRRYHAGAPVAVTEPVADYMLQAAGADVLTPRSLQSSLMNGTDPSPQGISLETSLLARHRVKALVYNEQVTDAVTAGFLSVARQAGVPVVAVYETMPVPGLDYQSWMLAEVKALERAVTSRLSTTRL